METTSVLTKKLPQWVTVVVASVVSACIIAAGTWAFNINATISSHKAEMEYLNTRSNDTKIDVNEAIKAFGKRLEDMEIKFDRRFEKLEGKFDKLNYHKKEHSDYLAKE